MKKYQYDKRLTIMNYLGGTKCIKCGSEEYEGLELDHINGDGKIDRERFGDSNRMVYYYSKHLDEAKEKLQVLCKLCNCAKNRKY